MIRNFFAAVGFLVSLLFLGGALGLGHFKLSFSDSKDDCRRTPWMEASHHE